MNNTELIKAMDMAELVSAQGKAIVVTSEQDLLDAVSFLGKIASAKKAIEDRRTSLVRPLNDEVKSINASFKPATGLLNSVDSMVRLKVSDWKRAEAIRIAEQRKQESEAEAARVAACNNGGEVTDEQATALAIADRPDQPIKRVNAEGGSAQFRKVWKFEVTNELEIPRQWLTVDEKKIGAAIRGERGVREIPGVRIYEEDQLAVSGA